MGTRRIDLGGRVVAVTGAGRGIGAATAAAVVAAGGRVALGDLDVVAAEATAVALGARASAHPLDVTDRGSFDDFLRVAEAVHGPVDTLVNNAGVMIAGPFLEEGDAATRAQVEVNLMGVVQGLKAALPGMVARGRGLVVNIASVAARAPGGGIATYSATKHAVAGLTEAVRAELHGSGVDVVMVLPAPVRTALLAGVPDLPTVPTLDPAAVADRIAAVIARPRAETYVPASVGVQVRLASLLPRRAKDLARRITRADDAYLCPDRSARLPYEALVLRQFEEPRA